MTLTLLASPQADGSWLGDGNDHSRSKPYLRLEFADEDASTVAGLVLSESRTIPSPGQESLS